MKKRRCKIICRLKGFGSPREFACRANFSKSLLCPKFLMYNLPAREFRQKFASPSELSHWSFLRPSWFQQRALYLTAISASVRLPWPKLIRAAGNVFDRNLGEHSLAMVQLDSCDATKAIALTTSYGTLSSHVFAGVDMWDDK